MLSLVSNDGTTIYRLNVKDAPVYGFWSTSLYNSDVNYEKNQNDVHLLKQHLSAKKGDGGRLRFKSAGATA